MRLKTGTPNSPCIECGERRVNFEYNCHTHCKRFAKWKQSCQSLKDKISAEKRKDDGQIQRWARAQRRLEAVRRNKR